MNTLFLLPSTWDLAQDAFGNIAMATEPYSLVQDAASTVRTFAGEVYYDTTPGLPYFTQIFGVTPIPYELIRANAIAAANTTPDIASTQLFFTGLVNRSLYGQLQVTSVTGATAALAVPLSGGQGVQGAQTFTLDASVLGGGDILG